MGIETRTVPHQAGRSQAANRRMVVFAPNWLGDAVMALPAIADIRRALPDATIDIAARAPIAPLVPLVEGIGTSVLLGERRASIEVLKAGGYDTALLLPNSFNAAWIARQANIAERWGFRNEFRSILLTRAIAPPVRVHQRAFYQHLTTTLGFAAGSPEPRLHVPQDLRMIGEDRLEESGWDRRTRLVAVAPGAAFGSAKRWPAERFASTIDALARDGVRSVLVGAGADARAGAQVLEGVHTSLRPLNLIGATDLSTLAAVLVQCRTLVTNDSGAMHFAAALGIDVAAVFGPTNEHETRPVGTGRMSVVHTDVWCRPCMLRECPLTHRCMTGVSTEAVLGAVKGSL